MTEPTRDEVRAWLLSSTALLRELANNRQLTREEQARHGLASRALALLDEGEQDSARLDWIEAQSGAEVVHSEHDDAWYVDRPGISHSGQTFRAAIDRARGA